ncbi:hypothetical protein EHS25_004778 [Saitozyma podzolica]|uniref:Peptidase A1 domain-containing protein n=1 Tax=Saitozyma podzolica TaxID=1890683 RepID=A0A427Y2Q7_9TREE|nr:hypothetical protein EHS25_004778 [Saitozyma podzolica]
MVACLISVALASLALLHLLYAIPIESEPLHVVKLRKIPNKRDGEHPMMAFQRHHNSAIKRMNKMSKSIPLEQAAQLTCVASRAPPPDSFFHERTVQRRRYIEEATELEQRLWFPPTSNSSAGTNKRMWLPPPGSLSSQSSTHDQSDVAQSPGSNESQGNSTSTDGEVVTVTTTITAGTLQSTAGAASASDTSTPQDASAGGANATISDGSAAASASPPTSQKGTSGQVDGAAALKSKNDTGGVSRAGGGASSGNTIGSSSDAAITVLASGSNANGFSNTDAQALTDNSVTSSTSNLITGGLNYEIEANDVGYVATVQIGTPAKDFLILMDSGSGDFWVPSASVQSPTHPRDILISHDSGAAPPSNAATTKLSERTRRSSSFTEASKQTFQVTYGSGAVTGTLCSDTVSIAGMTLQNHAFGVTTQESVQFSSNSVPFDGLMGLSFSKALSQQGVFTPIESLAQSGQVQQAIMGFALGRVGESTSLQLFGESPAVQLLSNKTDGENVGEVVFGSADTSKLDSSTTQSLNVSSSDGFWQVNMPAVTVNNAETSTARQAILDTGAPYTSLEVQNQSSLTDGVGTSLIVAPPADAQAFHAQIQGAQSAGNGMFTIPCTTNAVVTMTFGNAAFQIDPRDLLFQPVSNDLTGDCISAVSAGTVTDDQTWLLGDTFLKNVYFTTNVQTSNVELSARTDTPGVSVSSGGIAASSTTSSGTAAASAAESNRADMKSSVGGGEELSSTPITSRVLIKDFHATMADRISTASTSSAFPLHSPASSASSYTEPLNLSVDPPSEFGLYEIKLFLDLGLVGADWSAQRSSGSLLSGNRNSGISSVAINTQTKSKQTLTASAIPSFGSA